MFFRNLRLWGVAADERRPKHQGVQQHELEEGDVLEKA